MSPIAADTQTNKDAYAALVSGHHNDPFAVLGVHHSGSARIVRALQPQAEGRRVACYLHHDRAADGSRVAGGASR